MINGYNLKEVLQLVSAQWDSPCEERGRAHEAWGCLEPEVGINLSSTTQHPDVGAGSSWAQSRGMAS